LAKEEDAREGALKEKKEKGSAPKGNAL